jgi:hypothetical protein
MLLRGATKCIQKTWHETIAAHWLRGVKTESKANLLLTVLLGLKHDLQFSHFILFWHLVTYRLITYF